MNVLDLFSGIGGFSLGLEAAGMRTVAFCEIETYCQKILRRHWPDVPIHDDVRKLDGFAYRGTVELICGGYPCQPFSMAGRRRGAEDERHLWPQMYRLIREIRPRWVVAENVAGHISLGFDEVASSLEAEGFTVWPFIIPACAVGAPHRRDRVWIVGYAKHNGSSATAIPRGASPPSTDNEKGANEASQSAGASQSGDDSFMANTGRSGIHERWGAPHAEGEMPEPRRMGCDGLSDGRRAETEALADTECQRLPRQGEHKQSCRAAPLGQGQAAWFEHGRVGKQWSTEPDVGRVAHGVPHRVERLRALGNAVVPQIPFLIGQAILQYERGMT
ncbi:MAG: DNA cytosine methyltransferase [Alphaproteobacteria bacterium]|nr:DNA cytosine methyltransferase [Alphaproteobacteria bacterium]